MAQKWWIISSTTLAVFSFICLQYMRFYLWPDPNSLLAFPQLLLMVFIFLLVGSVAVPVMAYLNHRFATVGWLERDKIRLFRQGSWFGLFSVLAIYLQFNRALNWTIGVVLAAVFVLIEAFFLTRE